MFDLTKLKVGDIIGTTSGSPLAMAIKIRTWGWRFAFSQSYCSHIATVVDRGHGLLYFAEMLSKKLELTELHAYQNRAPRQHICWVGRHPMLENPVRQSLYNEIILELHAKKVKYGYEDLFNYILSAVNIQLKDKEDTLICSELPRVAFKQLGINYPEHWEAACSPKDWQCFWRMSNKTKEVLC